MLSSFRLVSRVLSRPSGRLATSATATSAMVFLATGFQGTCGHDKVPAYDEEQDEETRVVGGGSSAPRRRLTPEEQPSDAGERSSAGQVNTSAMRVMLGCFEFISMALSAVAQEIQSGRSGPVPRVPCILPREAGEGVRAHEDRQQLPPGGQETDHDDDDVRPHSAADDQESDENMFHGPWGKWSDEDPEKCCRKENSEAKGQTQYDGTVDLAQDEPLPKAAPNAPPIGLRSTVLDNPRPKTGGAPKGVTKELDLCGSASGSALSQRPPSRPSSSVAAAAIGVWAPPAPAFQATSHAEAPPVARTPTARDRHDAGLPKIERQRKEDNHQQRPKPLSIAGSSTSGKLSLPQVLENRWYAKQMHDAEHQSHGVQRQWRPKLSNHEAHDSKGSWNDQEKDQEGWTAYQLWQQHQEQWKECDSCKGWSSAASCSGGVPHRGQKRARHSDGHGQPELPDTIYVGGHIYHKRKSLKTSDKV